MASIEAHRPGVAEVARRTRLDRGRRLEIQDAGASELERTGVGVGEDVRDQRGALLAQDLAARRRTTRSLLTRSPVTRRLSARSPATRRPPARLRQHGQRAKVPAVGQRRVRLHQFVQADRAVAQRQAVTVDVGMFVEARESQVAQESQVRRRTNKMQGLERRDVQ